ncbi:flagellar basal-body MS-ring/collar protein FliF [Mycetocola miduiensis]|uniref:Flagellar M-ring protein n=1 Tax=Mycetocola miduiensis TaxID=995034 RepID=A0A1I4YVE1_9MICO|nr:flagellar basal-body MS-ring/collar protein FliF [Mycetocola miduiensis]SFN41927.1 flagellar M-ring protein FliF [Mycetocola miduiensis]
MPQQITSAFGRLMAAVRSFSLAQRTIAILGVAVLALGIFALSAWLMKPAYTPLFSGLSASDASTIVEQLQTNGVDYELANGGATILVPEQNVYAERLTAAAAGLPSSSTGGYSLLDEMGVTSSEFQQSVTYKRALEGELASTISALEGVTTASVRLAIPEETVFVSEKSNPTASVFVETKNGVTLSAEQVQAITHLTSASVDGMNAVDVAVIDAKGTVLSAVGVGATGTAAQQTTDYEQRVRSSVQAMLDRIVGPGNSTVIVAAGVNLESAERVEESFTTPENAPILTESSSTENYTGGAGGAAGVLGPDNIAVPGGATGNGNYTSESATKNHAIDKVTESRVIPAGSIERQTVSVALSADVAKGINVNDISALVSSAAGIDTVRGDEVTVEVVNFTTSAADEAAAAIAATEKAAADERTNELIRTGIIAAALLIATAIVLLIIRARRIREEAESALSSLEAGEFRDLVMTDATEVLTPLPDSLSVSAGPTPIDRTRAEIGSLAERNPEKTAAFLRGLMDEKQPV